MNDIKECLVFSDFMHSPLDWEDFKITLKKLEILFYVP